MNNWQQCPICNGTGSVFGSPYSFNTSAICPTCNGKRIISSLTGLPPEWPNIEQNVKGSDTNGLNSNSSAGSITTTEQVENFIKNPAQGL